MKLAFEVYEWVQPRWDEELINLQEQSMALYFNNANQLISYRIISTGNRRGSIINVQLLVCLALHTMASKVIVVHNHPSGNLEASKSDIKITKQIKAALELIDVVLLDHLIISDRFYISLCAHGLVAPSDMAKIKNYSWKRLNKFCIVMATHLHVNQFGKEKQMLLQRRYLCHRN